MKLHLGCGKRFLKGYKHVDYSNYKHVDYVSPIYPLSFIKDNSVSEIYCSHALEYFDFAESINVLKEWFRCLNNGGKLRISVPDFDTLLEVYKLNNHDIDSVIGPIFGKWPINEDLKIYHKTVFTKSKLTKILSSSGFREIESWDPLKFFGNGSDSFDDYSKAYFPHMDFKNGFSISINFIAKAIKN